MERGKNFGGRKSWCATGRRRHGFSTVIEAEVVNPQRNEACRTELAIATIAPGQVESPKDSAPEVALRRLSAKELSVDNLKPYDHGAFRVSYPANWEIVGDRNSSLTM
jgi:hypothetical protein